MNRMVYQTWVCIKKPHPSSRNSFDTTVFPQDGGPFSNTAGSQAEFLFFLKKLSLQLVLYQTAVSL